MAAPTAKQFIDKLKGAAAPQDAELDAPEAPVVAEEPGVDLGGILEGVGSSVVGLLPQLAGFATGGTGGYRAVTAQQEAARTRETASAKEAREQANELTKLQQAQQKIDIDAYDAETKRLAAKEASKKEKKPVAGQFLAGGFAKRLELAEDAFKKLGESGYDPSSIGAGIGKLATAGGFTGNVAKGVSRLFGVDNTQAQIQDQAERNFVNAVLRRESGAAISPSEFENARAQYLPQLNDSPETLALKQQNRDLALQALKAEAGDAYDQLPGGVAPKIAMRGQDRGKSAMAAQPQGQTLMIQGQPYRLDPQSGKYKKVK